jgi:dihydropteroate synthase
LIVQVSYNPEPDSKDFIKSSLLNLTISGIENKHLDKVSGICSSIKVKFEPVKNLPSVYNFILCEDSPNRLLAELNNSELPDISNEIKKAIYNYNRYDRLPVKFGTKEFTEPLIMGILNVTPDSFSDGGKHFERSTAVNYALEMLENGADIIDIGGESTRPGSDPVSEEEEMKRVIPVIEEILSKKPGTLISIDTYKSKVATEACKRGVSIINDISGSTFDPESVAVAGEYSASLIIMHIKGTPKTMQMQPAYNNLIFEIYEFLQHQADSARKSGVKNIIIDPGIGFGKKVEHNFEILKRISHFKSLGYPVLIGLSRKLFLGKTSDLDLMDRDTATVIAETVALRNGAKIIRTHNVPNAVKTRELLKLIYTE